MSNFDTGDIIIHKPNRDVYIVACVHEPWLHTAGFPEMRLLTSECVMKDQCSPSERQKIIRRMAQSSGKSHRAVCARERVTNEVYDEYGYYCD